LLEHLQGALFQPLAAQLSFFTKRVVHSGRRQEPIALFSLDGHPHLKTVRVREVDLTGYRGLTGASYEEDRNKKHSIAGRFGGKFTEIQSNSKNLGRPGTRSSRPFKCIVSAGPKVLALPKS
jgi:hypothetical protein